MGSPGPSPNTRPRPESRATLRAMTTEERLYKLEGIVEGVMATLPRQVASLEGRTELLRQELRAEIAALRQEMSVLRREMEEKFDSLRQEVKAEIAGLRQEMKTEINTALNRLMLYFTALAAGLALLTLFR